MVLYLDDLGLLDRDHLGLLDDDRFLHDLLDLGRLAGREN